MDEVLRPLDWRLRSAVTLCGMVSTGCHGGSQARGLYNGWLRRVCVSGLSGIQAALVRYGCSIQQVCQYLWKRQREAAAIVDAVHARRWACAGHVHFRVAAEGWAAHAMLAELAVHEGCENVIGWLRCETHRCAGFPDGAVDGVQPMSMGLGLLGSSGVP